MTQVGSYPNSENGQPDRWQTMFANPDFYSHDVEAYAICVYLQPQP